MRLLPAVLLCAACSKPVTRWEPVDLKALAATSHGDADRVWLLDEDSVQFELDPETGRARAILTEHARVQGLKPNALQRSVGATYDNTFIQRPVIRGRVLFPDGTQKDLEADKASDVPVWRSAILYNETRALNVSVPIVPKRGVLEYETSQRAIDLKPQQFDHAFGHEDPVVLSRFTVTAPATWQLEWTARELGATVAVEPTVEDLGATRRYTWERKDLPAHPREVHGVDTRLEVPVVTVRLKSWDDGGKPQAAFATPKELSAWLWTETRALSTADDAMKTTVQAVLQGAPDDQREKARRLYDYVCEKVQYCAIEVGYGGWFPHAASAVQQNKYGDCKDKANYLKGLLEVAGVKSRSTLIYFHSGYPLRFGLPSLAANFNHQILTIDLPDGPLLVDPTARSVAFGDLPVGDREATVLPIEEGGAELGAAPAAQPEHHGSTQTYDLQLSAEGVGRGDFALDLKGALAADLRSKLLTAVKSKQRDVVSDWLSLREARVTELSAPDGLQLVPGLTVRGKIEVPRVVLGEGQTRLVRLGSFASSWMPVLPDLPRRTPIVFWNRYQKTGAYNLLLPATLGVTQLPPRFTRTSKWLDYTLTWEAKGKTLVARRELTVKERIVPPAELQGLREVIDALHLAEQAPVVLGVVK